MAKRKIPDRKRSALPMHSSQRCGAKTRRGAPCQAPTVGGKSRCRMHGGAEGSGAPFGNQNALKHGLFTREALAERKAIRALIRDSKATLERLRKR